jgi:hypothetical protein
MPNLVGLSRHQFPQNSICVDRRAFSRQRG